MVTHQIWFDNLCWLCQVSSTYLMSLLTTKNTDILCNHPFIYLEYEWMTTPLFSMVWSQQLDLMGLTHGCLNFVNIKNSDSNLHPNTSLTSHLTTKNTGISCNHPFMHLEWVDDNSIDNDWVWFECVNLNILFAKNLKALLSSLISHIQCQWQH